MTGASGFILASVASAQSDELPAGAARGLVIQVCTQCHPVQQIAGQRHTSEEWSEILARMLGQGAVATDQQIAAIQQYLLENFGKGS